tara:strand:+ start:84 stop:1292 length:1209 start_codon:yes stop_codon:yes gene_type:complete
MKRIIIIALLGIIALTSCNTIKTISTLKKGEVEQQKFAVNIPFEYRLGLIVFDVTIDGQEYSFILDTGAPNVISKKLAEKLDLTSTSYQDVGDSQGEESKLGFTSIEKISIGGINFLNTGAAIADLSISREVACLNVDGFIGANLMKNAIWKFDYDKQIITISNSTESLNIPEQNEKVPFFTKMTGTPILDITLNSVTEKNVILDLGSNGDIALSKKTLDKIMKTEAKLPLSVSFGNSSSGLYGTGASDSIYYTSVSDVSFGDIALKNTIVEFTNESASTIGTNFFKNYDLVINWFDKEITLMKNKEYDNSSLSSYGFSYNNHNDSLIVSRIHNNSSAANEGLKINDIILEINGEEYGELTSDQWCSIVENGLFHDENSSITVVVLRDNEELTFNLAKSTLL